MIHSARYIADTNKLIEFGSDKTRSGAKGVIDSTGWHKSADVFLTDLYMVWRALEGLPVWCPYVAEKLGYWHASDIPAWTGGRTMSVEEAMILVGDVGAYESAVPQPEEFSLSADSL